MKIDIEEKLLIDFVGVCANDKRSSFPWPITFVLVIFGSSFALDAMFECIAITICDW